MGKAVNVVHSVIDVVHNVVNVIKNVIIIVKMPSSTYYEKPNLV